MGKATLQITPDGYFRILTNKKMDARDVAVMEGCSPNHARRLIKAMLGRSFKGEYTIDTDEYLLIRKGTNRAEELRNIYGKETQNQR